MRAAVCAPFPYGAVPGLAARQRGGLGRAGCVGRGARCLHRRSGRFDAGRLRRKLRLVGHSERRSYHGETDAVVAAKALRALDAGIVPVVCVGETLAQREAGETEAVVGRQLQAVLDALSVEQLGRVVLAYEPVWAIGTGKTATSAQAQAVHAFLRAQVAARDAGVAQGMAILYGGSVKPDNAAELFSMADIDGG